MTVSRPGGVRHIRAAVGTAWICLLVLATSGSAATSGASGKPPVPPGRDPGGPAVVLIGGGVDYRDRLVAAGLARDGEGDIVGLDLVDNDNRPFAPARIDVARAAGWDPDTTDLARVLVGRGVRIIPVRVPPHGSPERALAVARAVAFAAQTSARVVLLPEAKAEDETARRDWMLVERVAKELPHLLLVLPLAARAPPGATPLSPPAQTWAITVAATSGMPTETRSTPPDITSAAASSAEAAGMLAAVVLRCAGDLIAAARTVGDARRIILDHWVERGPAGHAPRLRVCPAAASPG